MVSGPLVRFILTAALRDRLMITLLVMIVLGASLATFLGGASVSEEASFALVFGAGGLRFLGVIGIVLFVSFYMRRSFETKEVEFLLSRPVSRMTFLFSHALAFMLLALAVALAVAAAVFFLGKPDPGGLAAWGGSIAIELSIMAVTSLFFSLVLSSAAGSALAALGVYVLSRMIGVLIGIAALPPGNVVFLVLNKIMDAVSVIVPRLDLMGQTSWLVYGVEGAGDVGLLLRAGDYARTLVSTLGITGFTLTQGVLFIGLLLAASAYDFSRRQF